MRLLKALTESALFRMFGLGAILSFVVVYLSLYEVDATFRTATLIAVLYF